MCNLYLITYVDQNGDNRDLLVVEKNPPAAFNRWLDYFQEGPPGPLVTAEDSGDLTIYQINADLSKPGTLNWGTSDIQPVAYSMDH